MSAVSLVFSRTRFRAHGLFSTVLLNILYLAASGVLFALFLSSAEGSTETVPVLWALAAALPLPFLAALLAADVWSRERRDGRLDLLFSIAVPERDFVVGKALGVLSMLFFASILSFISTYLALFFLAPSALAGVRLTAFLPGFLILFMIAAALAAAACALSALCRKPAAAAALSLVALAGLPTALWFAGRFWFARESLSFGEHPFVALVSDFAGGTLSSAPLVALAASVVFFLFATTLRVASFRLKGRGFFKARLVNFLAILLALVLAGGVSLLASRFDVVFDIPFETPLVLSPNHGLLDASGRVTVTAFLPRNAKSFRPTAQLMRTLKKKTDALTSLELSLKYVDPRWDLGAAERLVREGFAENTVIFEKSNRSIALDLSQPLTERAFLSALRHVAQPPLRRDIYWLQGHHERSVDDYSPWGLSDIARRLARQGYRNKPLALVADAAIPADAALLAVAGARENFSRAELARLHGYLRSGGRLLVLVDPASDGVLDSFLSAWGVKTVVAPLRDVSTLSGTDVIVSTFSSHEIVAPFRGARLILEKPASFAPSAVVSSSPGDVRLAYEPLATVGDATLAVAVERGGAAGDDLAVRPTRLVVVGDDSFVANGALAARGHANGDFLLNAVAFLAGSESMEGGDDPLSLLVSGLDRDGRRTFFIVLGFVVPLAWGALFALAPLRRRMKE